MFQWLPMDGVLTPALDPEAPDIIPFLLLYSYHALVHELSLFP